MSELETLAQLPSRSDPKKTYTVKRNPENGAITCDCPGWIYSKREPRSCRHTLVFEKLYSNIPINPGQAVETTPTGRVLSSDEVDARNIAAFGTKNPEPGQVANNPLGAARPKTKKVKVDPKKIVEESVVKMTIRTITFEDE